MQEKEFLRQACDRCIAKLLGYKDKEINHYLPGDVAKELRKEILDSFNDLLTTTYDLIDSKLVVNEYWKDQIAELHDFLIGEDEEIDTFNKR